MGSLSLANETFLYGERVTVVFKIFDWGENLLYNESIANPVITAIIMARTMSRDIFCTPVWP